ncbi:hypothetical protein DMB65_17410 [Flavobacterium cheongpyeongense]|uniref:Uncharacterized protein n=1 Tax=Flavobacterium cheongpyeongense TaxID=2212651 RepID=A0A2V4BKF2_9FLAO|nr:hypothetical protein DMB65_17410 [Flavobacterium cheongpyeongense]
MFPTDEFELLTELHKILFVNPENAKAINDLRSLLIVLNTNFRTIVNKKRAFLHLENPFFTILSFINL